MIDENVYASLGKMTEEMYLGLCKNQSAQMQDQLVAYHEIAEGKIAELLSKHSEIEAGEILAEQQKKIQILSDDFSNLKKDINSKYKIYLRGCGKAGKSTLLNALLSIDENIGSRMGRVPMTFTIDTYTDELEVNKAEVRLIDTKGKSKNLCVSRKQAIEISNKEEVSFKQSKEKCDAIIEERVRNVYLEQEREDIERDVYRQHLLKTQIREIKWGIGENNFFHNCVLIDTPGLSQELRFTNVIEDVKNYEMDGIIWVISSHTLAKQEVIEAYKEEFRQLKEVYEGKKVIAVINMYGDAPEYAYGSKLWRRVEKRAKEIYCGTYGFDDLICVNAKLAYDGNVHNDKIAIEESNISELRKKVNEMFVEKSTEEYHLAKLEKIDSFLRNLYREVEDNQKILEKHVFQYEDRSKKITSQRIACIQLFETRKEKIISLHMANIKQRIRANITRVNNLDDESVTSRQFFLENSIIGVNELESQIHDCMKQCEDIIFQRFKEQQLQSIISGYKTQKYALESFEKNVGKLSVDNTQKMISVRAPSGLGAGIYSLASGIFGKDSIVTGIVKFFRNAIKSPEERVYDDVRKYIKEWAGAISMDEVVKRYEEECRKTLDKSMEYTCCKYSDVCKMRDYMGTFIQNQSHMEWKQVGLMEIIGGESIV